MNQHPRDSPLKRKAAFLRGSLKLYAESHCLLVILISAKFTPPPHIIKVKLESFSVRNYNCFYTSNYKFKYSCRLDDAESVFDNRFRQVSPHVFVAEVSMAFEIKEEVKSKHCGCSFTPTLSTASEDMLLLFWLQFSSSMHLHVSLCPVYNAYIR